MSIEKAIIFATEKHSGQTRKGNGHPYIMHPIKVMSLLYGVKCNSKNIDILVMAALLHDLVEDTDVSIHEIADKFGYKVAAIVDELTSDKVKIEEIGKEAYLLDKMLKMSTYALCIKLCDVIHNLEDMELMHEEFKTKRIKLTQYLVKGLNENRELTKTHKKLIKHIEQTLKKTYKI